MAFVGIFFECFDRHRYMRAYWEQNQSTLYGVTHTFAVPARQYTHSRFTRACQRDHIVSHVLSRNRLRIFISILVNAREHRVSNMLSTGMAKIPARRNGRQVSNILSTGMHSWRQEGKKIAAGRNAPAILPNQKMYTWACRGAPPAPYRECTRALTHTHNHSLAHKLTQTWAGRATGRVRACVCVCVCAYVRVRLCACLHCA